MNRLWPEHLNHNRKGNVVVLPVDESNNVGRYCTRCGDTRARRWRVIAPAGGGRYYVTHVDSGDTDVVSLRDMRHLY